MDLSASHTLRSFWRRKVFFFLHSHHKVCARNCDAGDIMHGQHRWHSVSCCLVALALYTTCNRPLNNSIPIFHRLTLQDNLRVLISTLAFTR